MVKKISHRGTAGIHQTRQIQLQGLRPTLIGKLVQRPVTPPSPGASSHMIQCVETASQAFNLADCRSGRPRVLSVTLNDASASAEYRSGGGMISSRPAGNNHQGSSLQTGLSGRKPKSSRSADDDYTAIFQRDSIHKGYITTGVGGKQ